MKRFVAICSLLTAFAFAGGDLAFAGVEKDPLGKESNTLDRRTKLDYSNSPISLEIHLPKRTQQEKAREQEATTSGRIPLQIGARQTIPETYQILISQSLNHEWVQLDDGSIVKSISIRSPGARAVRAAILATLPDGGELRFFSPHIIALGENNATLEFLETNAANFPVITGRDFHIENGSQEPLWSPTVMGDTIGIEISLPSWDALPDFLFEVEEISRIFSQVAYLRGSMSQPNCENQIDVMCRSDSFPSNVAGSVARMQFVIDGDTYHCSGTLLGDEDITKRRYFLTANHCVSTPRIARSIEAIWFDQQVTCDVEHRSLNFIRTSPRATLLATSVAQDSTLLEFTGDIPNDVTLAGWTNALAKLKTDVYGIHHPNAAIKKYSAGKILARPNAYICGNPDDRSTCFLVKNSIEVDWEEGATEPGSSGSGLFIGDKLIGVLSGERGDCKTKITTYGAFADFFPTIKQWLMPGND